MPSAPPSWNVTVFVVGREKARTGFIGEGIERTWFDKLRN
jgi:hypothetical protein